MAREDALRIEQVIDWFDADTQVVDLSQRLETGMPRYPTHTAFSHVQAEGLRPTDAATSFELTMNEHAGTHVDAPAHFLPLDHPAHAWIDQLPPTALVGRGVRVDVPDLDPPGGFGPEVLQQFEQDHGRLRPGDVILLHTGQSRQWRLAPDDVAYSTAWSGLGGAAAEFLRERGVRAVGIDAIGIDPPDAFEFPAHMILLGAGIPIIENLTRLAELPTVSLFLGLPLAISGGSGSPLRAIAVVPHQASRSDWDASTDAVVRAPVSPKDQVRSFQRGLAEYGYLADDGLATVTHLAMAVGRPLLLEGEPGTGKTELAKVLARRRSVPLVRLQCHEGIDAAQAMYEWDHARQLLHVRALQADGIEVTRRESELYTDRFLLERPLLRTLRLAPDVVLLIDEIDRADDEFEAFLLEFLSEYQVTIPEHGQVSAAKPPTVILTSNRTRELHEALRRRCLYHWVDHPDVAREVQIIRAQAPQVPALLGRQVVEVVTRLRALELFKPPGTAETVDWARLLHEIGAVELNAEVAGLTLGAVIKDPDDLQAARDEVAQLPP